MAAKTSWRQITPLSPYALAPTVVWDRTPLSRGVIQQWCGLLPNYFGQLFFLRPTTLSEFGVASIFDWACTFLLLSVTKPKLEFNFLLQLPTENCYRRRTIIMASKSSATDNSPFARWMLMLKFGNNWTLKPRFTFTDRRIRQCISERALCRAHGRPHIGANGVSWPPPWNKNRKHAKRAVFYVIVYVIFGEQSGKAGVENGAMLTTYLFRYTSECTNA